MKFNNDRRQNRPERGTGASRDGRSSDKSSVKRDGAKPSFRSDKPFRSDRPASSDRPFRSDRPASSDRPFRSDRPASSDRPFRSDKPFKSDKPYRSDKPFGSDKPYKSDRPYKSDKPFNSDKPYRSDKPAWGEKPSRSDKPAWGEKPSRSDKPAWGERPSRSDKPAYGDKPYRSDKPSYGDKPYRSDKPAYGDKPFRSDKPFNSDRPYKSDKPFGERSFKSDKPYGDRPSRSDRPYKSDRDSGSRDYSGKPEFKPRSADFKQEDRPRSAPYFRPPGSEEQGAAYKETRFDEGKNMRPRLKENDGYDANSKYSKKKQLAFKKAAIDPNEPLRLNKFLANAGLCSRREADEYIKAGVVTVNGVIVNEMGAKVQRDDKVLFHDQLVQAEKKMYVLLNKPKDCVTTAEDTHARLTVLDLVKNACQERIYPVGRLDRNTTGVLLLTNDGDMAARLMHPKYNKKKIYHAHLDKALTKADMQQLADGIELEDGPIHADAICYVTDDNKQEIGVEVHSGRNRLVRRMFEHLGYKVVRLDRVYFAGLTKKSLPRGKWRLLTDMEISMLQMGSYE